MQFLTDDECRAWADGHGYSLTSPPAAVQERHSLDVRIPAQPAQLAFCRAVAEALEPRSSALLWIVGHGVWPSSENWHLYYRLRESYGDRRLLHDAPGHLFLDYESADFVTFLQLTIASGWEAEILVRLRYGGGGDARVFVSHDEFVVLAHRDAEIVETWRKSFRAWSSQQIS